MRLRLGFTTYNRLGNTRNHVWEACRSPRIIYRSLRRINHIIIFLTEPSPGRVSSPPGRVNSALFLAINSYRNGHNSLIFYPFCVTFLPI
ncbi:hypothetical protein Hanom_Chr10g00919481 [Helianthus anomalus]